MRFAVVVLVACGLAACARAPLEPREIPPAPAQDPAALVRAVVERERSTETLTALFDITVRRADGPEEKSRGALAIRRPDQLRLQIFSLGILTAYDFVASGDRYHVRLPLEGRAERGTFGEGEDPRYDLRPLFLGREHLERGSVRVEGDRVHVRLDEDPGWRRAVIDRRSGLLVEESWGRDDAVVLRARYADDAAVDGVPLPRRIRVEWLVSGVVLEIEISEYRRNRPLPEGTFRIREAT